MNFLYDTEGVRARERQFEIGMEVRAMNKVPGVNAFAGLVISHESEKNSTRTAIVDHKADEPFRAASINKLAIGLALARLFDGKTTEELNATMLSWEELTEPQGGGVYDQPGSPQAASVLELVRDMLSNSGNTAAKALVNRVGGNTINERLLELGYKTTQLKLYADGTFDFGITTPRESISILRALINGVNLTDNGIVSVSQDSLTNSTSKYGVRANMSNTGRALANKTGQLNQDHDTPEALRHDVGLFSGPNGKQVAYAFFSRSSSDIAAQAANIAIGDVGHLLAKEAGIEQIGTTIAARRAIGKMAIQAVAKKAKERAKSKLTDRVRPRFKE